MSILGAEPLIARLVANQPCVCGGGFADNVKIERYEFPYEVGVVPGLGHQETAILAGVLTGLATFLFLALPILCCLCPCLPCMCCFSSASSDKGAIVAEETLEKTHVRHVRDSGSIGSADMESMLSYPTMDKNWQGKSEKWDYEDLHEVDMKIPRVWMDTLRGIPEDEIDAKLHELQQGGWEGMDFRHSDLHTRLDGGEHHDQMVLGGDHSLGRRSARMASESSAMRESGNVEQFTEYETTREMNFQAVALNLPEHEYIYERDLRHGMDSMDKDNFMKIYWKYRTFMDDSKKTAF